MQQEHVFSAVMKRAAQLGALQPLEQMSMDLGTKITVKSALFDSIRTIIGYEITESEQSGYVPSKASLIDYEHNQSYTLLGVRRLESADPFPWFLEFEPVAPGTKSVTLTIEEMQVMEGNTIPMIKINTLYDPWDSDPNITQDIYDKLENWRAELQPEKEYIPPVWQCEGHWQFTIYPNLAYREYYCKSHECYIRLPIVDQAMRISRIDCGLSGSLLYCDSYHSDIPDNELTNWNQLFMNNIRTAKNPLDFAKRMNTDDFSLFRPMFFKLTLESKENEYVYPTTGSGPWGIFNSRLYYMSDAVEDPNMLKIKIDELFNVSLKNPWEIPMQIRDIDLNMPQTFSLTSPFLSVNGLFTLKDLNYDEEYLVMNHDLELQTGNIDYLRFREVKLLDKTGFAYSPIDKSSHWSEKHGKTLRGFTFPPVQYRGGDAIFQIKSIDVAPIVPFQFDVIM